MLGKRKARAAHAEHQRTGGRPNRLALTKRQQRRATRRQERYRTGSPRVRKKIAKDSDKKAAEAFARIPTLPRDTPRSSHSGLVDRGRPSDD